MASLDKHPLARSMLLLFLAHFQFHLEPCTRPIGSLHGIFLSIGVKCYARALSCVYLPRQSSHGHLAIRFLFLKNRIGFDSIRFVSFLFALFVILFLFGRFFFLWFCSFVRFLFVRSHLLTLLSRVISIRSLFL